MMSSKHGPLLNRRSIRHSRAPLAWLAWLALAAATLGLAGCMVGKTTHTLYLESDGTMTWVVEESQMRSSEEEPEKRQDEETEWLAARESETHRPAEALWQIGARTVETLVVRDRRPFQVVTRATFDDPGDALRRLFAASGLIGEVDVARNARGGAVAIRIDVEATEAAEASEQAGHDAERPTDSLLLGDDLLVMVAGGSFVASVGFTVDDDQARLDEDSIERALERDPATLRLYLEWQHHE